MTNHKYTTELLYHFNCGECSNWWSYASTESWWSKSWEPEKRMLSCPHCGYRCKIELKDVNGKT